MPHKELLKQLEIEKQRRGIGSGTGDYGNMKGLPSKEHRFAWEYELEAYRAQKKKIKWLAAGATCGVLSLVLEIAFHWGTIMGLAGIWPFK